MISASVASAIVDMSSKRSGSPRSSPPRWRPSGRRRPHLRHCSRGPCRPRGRARRRAVQTSWGSPDEWVRRGCLSPSLPHRPARHLSRVPSPSCRLRAGTEGGRQRQVEGDRQVPEVRRPRPLDHAEGGEVRRSATARRAAGPSACSSREQRRRGPSAPPWRRRARGGTSTPRRRGRRSRRRTTRPPGGRRARPRPSAPSRARAARGRPPGRRG